MVVIARERLRFAALRVLHLRERATAGQRLLALILLDEAVGKDTAKRHVVSAWVTGKASSKRWSDADVLAWLDLLEPEEDPMNPGTYRPSRVGVARVERMYQEAIEAEGQLRMDEADGRTSRRRMPVRKR